MLAGGMVIAAPSMVPEAAAAGALYVSAENAQFGNLFAGPMIVEVIVKDSNRSATNESAGEPTVLVDNQRLRMAQGIDGNWYGYFGDDTDITTVETVYAGLTYGLDFGTEDTKVVQANSVAISTYAAGLYTAIPSNGGIIDNPPALSNWNNTGTPAACSACGQIGMTASEWPFIQSFDFTQGDFDVKLEQAGADEIVTLDHNNSDLDDYASLTLDRSSATQGSEVMLFIVDQQLNIDPTDEDVVIFKVPNGGVATGASVSFTNGTINAGWTASDTAQYLAAGAGFGFSDNGKLLIHNNTAGASIAVLEKTATNDDTLTATDSGFMYLVFFEDADNAGTFSNVDDADNASLNVKSDALRGTTATFDYNDSAQSFQVSNDFGVIDMDEASIGDEWNSGEVLSVTLTDQDLNKNTLSNEDLTIDSDLIPSLQIGSPLTIGASTTIEGAATTVFDFSKIANVSATLADKSRFTSVSVGFTVAELRTALSGSDYSYVNYDLSQVIDGVSEIEFLDSDYSSVLNSTETVAGNFATVDYEALDSILAADSWSNGSLLVETDTVLVNFTGTSAITVGDHFYVDIFTFGDGTSTSDRVNNAIYRLYLEESGDDTGVLTGSVEYVMLNQLNVDTSTVFDNITPASVDIDIIVHEDLTDEDSPRINYLDLGADGVSTQVADQVAAPSHSGVVSLDLDNYKTADTVVVTLDDQDLNTNSDLIDVYITQTDDLVGNGGADHIVDITFNDSTWTGLSETGFTLVETAIDSGIFVGSFQIPSGVTGQDIEVNYNDHRDASGETIEVGDGASVNANTGTVTFDRSVYPVPYGAATGAMFKLHSTAGAGNLDAGDVVVHIRVTDADYDVSAAGEDQINDGVSWGDAAFDSTLDHRVVIKVERGSNEQVISTPGNSTTSLVEVSPDSGVFEYDQTITFTDGPSSGCPSVAALTDGCILQGDIVTVQYKDSTDASGKAQTVVYYNPINQST